MQLVREIGLYLEGIDRSFSSFGTGKIMASSQEEGMVPYFPYTVVKDVLTFRYVLGLDLMLIFGRIKC
jgi:hypothetical protein